MILLCGKLTYLVRNYHNVALPTTEPTFEWPGISLGICNERPWTNHLSVPNMRDPCINSVVCLIPYQLCNVFPSEQWFPKCAQNCAHYLGDLLIHFCNGCFEVSLFFS
jgi:hypothetical protein